MILLLLALLCLQAAAIQQLQVNEVRERMGLEGMWTLVREPTNGGDVGLKAKWNEQQLADFQNATEMPVPSAFNDLGDRTLRDHFGWVWYERYVSVPPRISTDRRVFIRLDSVNYYAIVFVNGAEATRHEGGHLPFEVEITHLIQPHTKITIAVNNTLSLETVPQGEFVYNKPDFPVLDGKNITLPGMERRYPEGSFQWKGPFDFFHYAGILRPVQLLFRPKAYLDGFKINADMNGNLNYTFRVNGEAKEELKAAIRVRDSKGTVVFEATSLNGSGHVENAQLWYPRGLGQPNLYTIEATLSSSSSLVDVFRSSFGFRSVAWSNSTVSINGKPLYCMGVGWHEESADLGLFKWLGVNCVRTTHYPYAEETIDEADKRGIAVILEVPSVSPTIWNKKSQLVHIKLIHEAIARDSHHPSVFMWSLSNEPFAFKTHPGGREYFKPLIELAHELDSTRPVTIVHGQARYNNDYLSDLLDVICINRYYGWYIDMGVTPDQIERDLYFDISMWKEKYDKPLMLTEYGAEHIPGIISDPPFAFSEQYQNEVYAATHKALDRLKAEGKITGEFAWVFADFMTHMTTTRVGGNHKGLFTRDRQPKQTAYIIRDRYNAVLKQMEKDLI